MSAEFQHPIQVVVRRTGLSAHVIRIWEKRYGAVEPGRTATNRRLYSDEQIERLVLLRDLTRAGQSIGFVAKQPTEKLRELATAAGAAGGASVAAASGATAALAGGGGAARSVAVPTAGATPAELLEDCLAAVRALDAHALEQGLTRAETALGAQGMLRRVVAPLAQAIGEEWRAGGITVAHEHFASAVLRTYLAQAARGFAAGGSEPVLLVATPAGQLHELGALLVAAVAANLGWNVTYLGASLPAPEIAGAARQNRTRAVALSLVYPADDPRLEPELSRLRDLLPPEVRIIVGGQAAPAYRPVLDRIGALHVADLAQFASTLDQLRLPTPAAGATPLGAPAS
ncbi:MerR family transcriptional regulator [Opitutus sp. ER46]|uniref:MerR family transcriptional regulator n=1 Tax=Opitutus sp. ER46 TaxID=2161864 RepID=UPI000D306055|nr:MerR family transcriptional regulator [Opitutus sp. ER46]PTX98535.1 transcriptional regulator [Opitutus sp. ER46]